MTTTTKTPTIHSRSENKWRDSNTACGKTVPEAATTEDALAITCGAQACQNEKSRVLRALMDATTESRTYEMWAGWDEPRETIGTLSYPLGALVALVQMPKIGVSLGISDEAEAERCLKFASSLLDACRDAARMVKARAKYPDAAERLAAAKITE